MLLGLCLTFTPAIIVTLFKAPPCLPWGSQGERLADIHTSHSVHLDVDCLLCGGYSMVNVVKYKDPHILCPLPSVNT